MNSDNKQMYDSAVDNLLVGINEHYRNWTSNWDNPTDSRNKFKDGLSVKPGRKFDKVLHGNSVWGFVAKTDGVLKGIPYFVGDVFKAASWRGPAKHVRGSIFSDNINWYQWTGPNYL
jgi:hypothetical protein